MELQRVALSLRVQRQPGSPAGLLLPDPRPPSPAFAGVAGFQLALLHLAALQSSDLGFSAHKTPHPLSPGTSVARMCPAQRNLTRSVSWSTCPTLPGPSAPRPRESRWCRWQDWPAGASRSRTGVAFSQGRETEHRFPPRTGPFKAGQPTSLPGSRVLCHPQPRQPYLRTSEALSTMPPQEFPPRRSARAGTELLLSSTTKAACRRNKRALKERSRTHAGLSAVFAASDETARPRSDGGREGGREHAHMRACLCRSTPAFRRCSCGVKLSPPSAGMRKAAGPMINTTMALSENCWTGREGELERKSQRLGAKGEGGREGKSQRLTSIQPCLQGH